MKDLKKVVKKRFNLNMNLVTCDFDREIFFCNVEDQNGNWKGLELNFDNLESTDFHQNVIQAIEKGKERMPLI